MWGFFFDVQSVATSKILWTSILAFLPAASGILFDIYLTSAWHPLLKSYLTVDLTSYLTYYPYCLTSILTSDIFLKILHANILRVTKGDETSDIWPDIPVGISSDMLLWHTFWRLSLRRIWHAFWHHIWNSTCHIYPLASNQTFVLALLLTSCLTFSLTFHHNQSHILSNNQLFWHCFWHLIWHGLLTWLLVGTLGSGHGWGGEKNGKKLCKHVSSAPSFSASPWQMLCKCPIL